MAEVGAYYITILPSMNSFTKAANKALGASGTSGGKTFASRFGEVLSGTAIGTALGNLATKAGEFLVSGLDAGIKRYDTMSNYPKIMQNLGYSTEEAAKSVKTIQDHLDGLPTSTDEMVRLTTAIADSTDDLDLATRAALGFNDMLLAGGASTAEMTTATDVLNRVLGKQNATLAQWRSLQSVMPAQLNQVGEAMLGAGKNSTDLYYALQDGTVSWQDFLRAIAELDESGYIDGTGKQMASLEQQARDMTAGIGTAIDNIPNRVGAGWAAILDVFGQQNISGVINDFSYGVRDAMWGVADWLTYARDKIFETNLGENLRTMAQAISGAMAEIQAKAGPVIEAVTDKMVSWIDRALQWLIDHGDQIKGFFDKVADAVGRSLADAGKVIESVGGVMGDLIGEVLEWLLDHGDLVAGAIELIGKALLFKGVASAASGVLGVFKGADGIIGSFKSFAEVLPIMEGLKDIPDMFAVVAQAGGPLGGVFEKLSGAFGSLGGLGTKLGGIFGKLGGGWTSLTGLIAAHPIALGIAAVAAAVAGLTWFFTRTETGKQLWADFTGFLEEKWDAAKEWLAGIPEWWGGVWDSVKASAADLVDNVKAKWEEWTTDAAATFENVKATIAATWENIQTEAAEKWEGIKTAVGTAWESLKTKAGESFGNMKSTIGNAWNATKTKTAEVWNNAKTTIGNAWDNIKSKTSNITGNVKTNVSNAWSSLKAVTSSAWSTIKTDIAQNMSTAKEAGSKTAAALKSALQGDWQGAAANARSAFDTIRNHITQRITNAKEMAVSAANAIGERLGFPGLGDRVRETFDRFRDTVRDKMDSAKELIHNAIETIKGLFDFHVSFPHINLPHFDWHWEHIGGVLSLPHFDGISWWGKGGIFGEPSVIGVGEAGPEAVLPLNAQSYRAIARGIVAEGGGAGGQTYIDMTGSTYVVREEADIERIADRVATRVATQTSRERWAR